jgi:hypothetical protein
MTARSRQNLARTVVSAMKRATDLLMDSALAPRYRITNGRRKETTRIGAISPAP